MQGMRQTRRIGSWLLVAAILTLATFAIGPVSRASAADEYDGLRDKWKVMLTGGTSYDTNDTDIASRVASISSSGQSAWDSMNKSAGRTYLWSDSASATLSADITRSYSRLRNMAIAFSTTGSTLQGNSTLLSDIKSALDWMYSNRYNEGVTWYDNWWDWEIGSPSALNDITVLLYSQLSSTQVDHYMDAVEAFSPDPTLLRGDTVSTASNRVWKANVVAVRGVIVKSSTKLASARNALSDVFDYVTEGHGFYEDGSYIFHENIPYNGGYGRSLLNNMVEVVELLSGSTWQVTDPDLSNMYEWVYDSFEPLVYKGAMMSMVSGREISRIDLGEHVEGQDLVGTIIRMAQFAPSSNALAYKRMAKYWILSDTSVNFYDSASLYLIGLTKTIMNDSGITPRGELVGHYQFPNMDRVVHLRPGFGFGISMQSTRIHNFEILQNENLRAFHMSDGMTYLYNNDLMQFSDNYWPTVNSYRLPGTTVLKNSTSTTRRFSDQNWVGGASLLGLYGVTGMSLHPYNQELTGKKSWFMFDDEIVALGAGISSTDGITVESVVENRKLNASGDNAFTVDGSVKSTALGWSETMTGTSWAHLAGNVVDSDIGYYFPGTATVKALREEREGSWKEINDRPVTPTTLYENRFLNLWFDHGTNPSGASYSYVLLPNRTAAQTSSYASNPDIAILENSTQAQAVKETVLNVIGANFWEDKTKTVGIITSNRQASVMTKETAMDIEVSVADPTHLNGGVIEIGIAKSGTGLISADSAVTVLQYTPTIKLRVDVKDAHGKTFKAKFSLTGTQSANPAPPALPEPLNVVIVDNADHGFANDTAWKTTSSIAGYNGVDYAMDGTSGADATKWAMWTPHIGQSGYYSLYMRWTDYANRPDAAPLEINYDGGVDTYHTVNQQQNGGEWIFINNYPLAAGTGNYVKLLATDAGYTIADAVKFVRKTMGEAEDMPAMSSSGDALTTHVDSAASSLAWSKLNANASDDYVQYELDVPEAGTYDIRLRTKMNNTRGKFKLYLPQDGAYVGDEQDQYSATDHYSEITLGTYTFATGGTKQFRFIVTGKNASSIGYSLGNDFIKLVRKVTGEAESITKTVSGAVQSNHVDSAASGGYWNKLEADGIGDYIQYALNIPENGTYNIKLQAKVNNTRGKFKLYLPEASAYLGSEEDQYSATEQYVVYDFGSYTFNSSGTKQFRFIVTGKNASSTGYSLGNDYILLTRQ